MVMVNGIDCHWVLPFTSPTHLVIFAKYLLTIQQCKVLKACPNSLSCHVVSISALVVDGLVFFGGVI